MKNTVSIRFFLYEPEKSNHQGKPKVYVRITVDRKKAEICLNHSVAPNKWDDENQKVRNDRKLNEELLFVANKIQEIRRDLLYKGQPISAQIIKDIYLGKSNHKSTIVSYYQSFINRIKNLPNDYSVAVLHKHENTLTKVKAFLHTRGQSDILLEQINHQWVTDFDYYLLTTKVEIIDRPLSKSTVYKQHAWLKTILIRAMKDGLLSKNPYADFHLKKPKSTREYLSTEELKKLQKHALGKNPSLIKVRDIFLFSVYTGLRFTDAMSLKEEHVVKDSQDRFWIDKIQEKTEERVLTPMLKKAVEIYEKYNSEERKISGHILPKISNQKLNTYLKTIAELVGIKKTLTHHVARHTFATTITLSNEVPLEVVSKWLGHTSIKTSQIYARITSEYFSDVVDKLDKKL